MKRRNNPAYWQLDAFVCGMIALGVLIMCAHMSARWAMLIDVGWATLAIVGMSVWVGANWPALRDEERGRRSRHLQNLSAADRSSARDVPLTPVQRQFLDTTRPQKRL